MLQRLVDGGNTVVVIEHHMDVVKNADHIIDLGPLGGDRGGRLVAEGTPEEVALVEESFTGQYLRPILRDRLPAAKPRTTPKTAAPASEREAGDASLAEEWRVCERREAQGRGEESSRREVSPLGWTRSRAGFRQAVLAMDGVQEGESVFSEGTAFWVNGKQVAHFMDDGCMEIRLTKAEISAQTHAAESRTARRVAPQRIGLAHRSI